jgi:uncharacterized membrane protein
MLFASTTNNIIINFDAASGASSTFAGLPNGTALAYASAVPIPPALWLFGAGLMGLIGMAKKAG